MCTARSGGRRGWRVLLAALVVLLVPLLQAPPAFAVRGGTCEELLIPLSDGTRLHGWAHHGVNAGAKRPILWTMTPYTNTGCPGGTAFGTATPEMFDKSTAVSISYRGTGASEGEQDAWGPGDRKDVQEVGDWLAEPPLRRRPGAHRRLRRGCLDRLRARPPGGQGRALDHLLRRRVSGLRPLRRPARGRRGDPDPGRDAGLRPGARRPYPQRHHQPRSPGPARRDRGERVSGVHGGQQRAVLELAAGLPVPARRERSR